MPLRDHSKSPFNSPYHLQTMHGMWPGTIVEALNDVLSDKYRFGLRVNLGQQYEIDVAGFDVESEGSGYGGAATAIAPAPTLCVPTEAMDEADYGVDVYELDGSPTGRLVAVIELVSPANKDRPKSRKSFAAKCANLWRQKVCVTIIDVVGEMHFNLYEQSLAVIGHHDPAFTLEASPQYAATFRGRNGLAQNRWQIECWAYPLTAGDPLPRIPIWLNESEHVMLDLESTYEQTIRKLRLDTNPR